MKKGGKRKRRGRRRGAEMSWNTDKEMGRGEGQDRREGGGNRRQERTPTR